MFGYGIVILCVISCLSATKVDKCAGGGDLPENVDVSGCTAQPCDFVRGQDISMNLTFNAPRLITNFKPLAEATALGLTIDYPLGIDDGCSTLIDSECPLDEQDEAIYNFKMNVLTIFPLVSLSIEFTLIDQDDVPIVCFKVAGRTVDK